MTICRISGVIQSSIYGKKLLKKFVHLFGSNRKFLVYYFGDAQCVFSVTYQIEKSLADLGKLFVKYSAID